MSELRWKVHAARARFPDAARRAAVAAVIWALFLGLVRYRSMTLRTLAKATLDTIETTASVLFSVTAASIFA